MIRVLIIEDEIPARKKLKRFLETLNTPTVVVAEIDTVAAAISFLSNDTVDLIFSDIELLDGNAFSIFQAVSPSCPIIFTTAYDHFWMDAFDGNGIAYLLKPFSQERFQKAWNKFLLLKNTPSIHQHTLTNLTKLIEQSITGKSFKKRFTIHTHQGIHFLNTDQVTFFEANDGVVFAYDTTGKKHLIGTTTLTEIEEALDPSDFFRINRSELVNKPYIERIDRYTKNTLAITVKGHENHLKTSQSNTSAFREWVNQ